MERISDPPEYYGACSCPCKCGVDFGPSTHPFHKHEICEECADEGPENVGQCDVCQQKGHLSAIWVDSVGDTSACTKCREKENADKCLK